MTCHGWLSWLPRTLFLWLLVSVGFLTTRVAQAASSPLGKALAMARPGVTYVQTIYEGSVRYHDRTYGPYQVGIHGSGVSVTPDGYIVTLAAVVDLPPVDVARLVIGAFEDDARQATQRRLGRSLTADDREQIARVARTDVTMGSVRRRVRVRVGSAIVAADNEVAEAQVVRERTEAAPDLALLKIEHGSVPTVPLNRRSEATTDGGVVCLGFPGGGMVATRSGAAQPLETTLVTSGTTGAPGLSMALDVAVSPGFQAGPCFSGDGTMVGLLGQPRAGTIKASSTARLILMKPLDQLLASVSVHAEGGQGDTVFQSGLERYWSRHYTGALERFAETQRLLPSLEDAAAYSQLARKEVQAGHDLDAGAVARIRSQAPVLVLLAPLVVGGSLLAFWYGRSVARSRVTTGKKPVLFSEQFSLAILTGPQRGEVMEVWSTPAVVGRGAECNIRIEDPSVSRQHAEIHLSERSARVKDLGSANGTFVNGRPAGDGARSLHYGDRIQFGDIEAVVTRRRGDSLG